MSWISDIESAFGNAGLDATVQHAIVSFRVPNDSGFVSVRVLPTAIDASTVFAEDGNQFRPPRAVAFVTNREGKTVSPQAQQDRPPEPILSSERVPDIGDEAFVWRGYGHNHRGVIKLRSGRFVVEINAPSVEEAKRLARGSISSLR